MSMFHLGFQINTTPLQQTTTAAQTTAQALNQMGAAAQGAQNAVNAAGQASQRVGANMGAHTAATRQSQAATQSATATTSQLAQQLQNLSGTLQVNQQDLQGLMSLMQGQGGLIGGLNGAAGAFGRLAAAVGPVGLALIGLPAITAAVVMGAKKLAEPFAQAQDQMGLFDARMRNALGSVSAANQTMGQLYDSTQKTGLGFRETADAFLRLARNGEALGASKAQLIQLTDVVQKLGAVSGASRGEIGSGLLQLSQALASGRLNGDELRSIMENMPALAKAIADNLGVGLGALRQMGAAGELSGDKVFQALLRASDKANKEFEKLPDTIERSNQRSADAWDRLLGTLGKKFDASGFVQSVNNFFTKMVNKANDALAPDSLGAQIAGLQAQRERFETLPGREGERKRASLDAQIARLQAKGASEMRQVSEANEEDEKRLAFAGIKRVVELGGNEYDDYVKKVKKARDEAQQLQDAIGNIEIRIKTGVADPSERGLLPALRRQAANARAELYDLAGVLEKAKRDLNDSRLAQALGGGGGGTAIVSQAQKQAEQARTKGGGSVQQFIDLGVDQALIKGNEQITTLERQTETQTKLQQTVGKTRAEVIEFEVANERASKKLELLGTLGGKKAEEWADRYAAALRRSKQAADDLANANARLALQDQIDLARQQMDAVGNPFEQRRLANESQARGMARTDPVRAAMLREQFGLQERSSVASTIDTANRNAAFNRSVTGLDADAVREAELNRRIRDAQRNAPRDQASQLGIAQAMRDEDATQRTRQYVAQEQALERQLKLLNERQMLEGLLPDEYKVQLALLTKRNQLEAEGAPPEVIDRQLRITELIERQTIAYERQNRQLRGVQGAFDRLGDGIESSFRDAIEKGLGEGTKNGLKQFEFSFRSAIRKMGAELTYEIGIRPFVEMLKNMAIAFGQRLAGSLFGGGPGNIGFPSRLPGEALGGAYAGGGVRMFATGGTFTNSIVSSPTLFAFAGGGALGVMGEAGPEAIMPLKRGRDGSLGVVAGGGGGDVQVVINDMRSNPNAPEVKVAQSRGPDNRRVLQVMVRDEVRRVVRSGELDTEMYSNFGVARSVARK